MSLVDRLAMSRVPVAAWCVLVCGAAATLITAMVPAGPSWLGTAGAIAVAGAYAWALAARTGGRPIIFGLFALVLCAVVLFLDEDSARTGAAVVTCALAAVLAVMVTVPAPGMLAVVRETLVASVVSAVGAMAVVGFEPVLRVDRFEYAAFGLALVGAFALVYRLGAGLHGLGRRGLLIVVVGAVLVAVTVLYAELLRRYGTPGLVDFSLDTVHWSRDHLGAFPRPIATILGVPALAYGIHMRARRRQGWWVCAFGVAYTSMAAGALTNPSISRSETTLSLVYSLVIGLLVGYAVIRLDLALTGDNSRLATGSVGRQGRRAAARAGRAASATGALRPEPKRWQPLL